MTAICEYSNTLWFSTRKEFYEIPKLIRIHSIHTITKIKTINVLADVLHSMKASSGVQTGPYFIKVINVS